MVNKITTPPNDQEIIDKINELVDADFLQNIATGTGALNIIGTTTGGSGSYSVSMGYDAKSTSSSGIAIGYGAVSANSHAIQIGGGTNHTKTSLYVGFGSQIGNYQLLDGTTGLIPDARISSNIARTSAIPINISALTNDSGYITGITSSDVTTALGYTPYSNSNPDGYITSISSSDVTTALGYTPYSNSNPDGYITGITSSDVTSALGYTPYNSNNPSGYISGISSSDVTTALGYIPYDSTNPSGYTNNKGTVTSVNNVQPDAQGNVTIPTGGTVDQTFTPSSTNAQSGVAINGALSPFIAITSMGRTGTAWYCEFSNGEIWQGDVTPTGVTSYAVTLPYEMDISGGEYNIELTTLHRASDTGGYNAISVVSAYPSGVLSTGFTISQATADYTCWTVRGKKKVS